MFHILLKSGFLLCNFPIIFSTEVNINILKNFEKLKGRKSSTVLLFQLSLCNGSPFYPVIITLYIILLSVLNLENCL